MFPENVNPHLERFLSYDVMFSRDKELVLSCGYGYGTLLVVSEDGNILKTQCICNESCKFGSEFIQNSCFTIGL